MSAGAANEGGRGRDGTGRDGLFQKSKTVLRFKSFMPCGTKNNSSF